MRYKHYFESHRMISLDTMYAYDTLCKQIQEWNTPKPHCVITSTKKKQKTKKTKTKTKTKKYKKKHDLKHCRG